MLGDHRQMRDSRFLIFLNTQGHFSFFIFLPFLLKWYCTRPQTSAVLYFPARMKAMLKCGIWIIPLSPRSTAFTIKSSVARAASCSESPETPSFVLIVWFIATTIMGRHLRHRGTISMKVFDCVVHCWLSQRWLKYLLRTGSDFSLF